jgi:hypothetical protein
MRTLAHEGTADILLWAGHKKVMKSLKHTSNSDGLLFGRLAFKKRCWLLWIAVPFLAIGVGVAIYCLVALVLMPTKSRPADFYSAIGESLLVAVLGIEGIIAVLHLVQAQSDSQEEQRQNLKEATDAIFREWWERDMDEARSYFFQEFLAKHWAQLHGVGLKEVQQKIKDDRKVSKLTGFFDRVGWLGEADLIDVDFVLGPMQHVMRRVWFVTEALIMKEREPGRPERLDPVYRRGFQWLIRRSEQEGMHQTDLLARHCRKSDLTPQEKEELKALRRAIEEDERRFKEDLKTTSTQTTSFTSTSSTTAIDPEAAAKAGVE